VGLDAQECLTQCDEAGDVQKGIWRELMQLHVVHKQEPMKKFVGRKRETVEEESKNITQNSGGGAGMTSVLGR
jgi:hypothetical protein